MREERERSIHLHLYAAVPVLRDVRPAHALAAVGKRAGETHRTVPYGDDRGDRARVHRKANIKQPEHRCHREKHDDPQNYGHFAGAASAHLFEIIDLLLFCQRGLLRFLHPAQRFAAVRTFFHMPLHSGLRLDARYAVKVRGQKVADDLAAEIIFHRLFPAPFAVLPCRGST